MTKVNSPVPVTREEREALRMSPGVCKAVLVVLIKNGEHETIERMIKEDEAWGVRGAGDYLALCLLAERGWGSICKALIKAGAQAETRDDSGRTALMVASQAANSRAIKILVNCGADVNTRDDLGWTPLLAACSASWDAGRLKAVETLFNAGAKLEAQTHKGDTALSLLAARKDEQALDWVRKTMAQGQRDEFDAECAQAPSKARSPRV